MGAWQVDEGRPGRDDGGYQASQTPRPEPAPDGIRFGAAAISLGGLARDGVPVDRGGDREYTGFEIASRLLTR